MIAHIRELGELTSSLRRRKSKSFTASTGRDYSSSHQIDEDILFRIRSLLLSRNVRRPPRTPYTSDEERRQGPSLDDPKKIIKLDFSRAEGIAKRTRNSIQRLSQPGVTGRRLQTDGSNMDVDLSTKSPEPQLPSTKQLTLRSTSSASDLKGLLNDAKLHETDHTCCPLDLPGERTIFRLPRLVLRDKTPPDYTPILSCMEVEPQASNRCSQLDDDSEVSPRADKAYRPEAADLACFVAGCTSSECTKNHRQPIPAYKPKHELKTDIHAVARDVANDISKLSKAVRGVEYRDQPVPVLDCEEIHICEDKMRRGSNPTAAKVEELASPETKSIYDCSELHGCEDRTHGHVVASATHSRREFKAGISPDLIKSPVLNPTSSDAIPHVMKSREATAKKDAIQSLSATIDTNFSLPCPKSPFGIALVSGEKFPPAESEQAGDSVASSDLSLEMVASTKPKTTSPSILSIASRTPARHALLKLSISASSPIDTSLPIPPILTEVAVKAMEKSLPEDDLKNGEEAESAPVISNLDNLRKARDIVSCVEAKIREASQALKQELGSPPRGRNPCSTGVANDVLPETQISRPKPLEEANEFAKLSETLPVANSPNAAYWGFIPAAKEAVQGAVQIAIVKAVHEIKVPAGINKDEASATYRNIVGESLSLAAQSADEYLRRLSLWENPPTPENRENEGQKSTSQVKSYQHLVAIPLASADESDVENGKPGWKISTPFNKSSPEYTAIPTRGSSRSYVLKPKSSGIQLSGLVSTRAVGSIERSLQAIEAIRSISSLGSLSGASIGNRRAAKRGNSYEKPGVDDGPVATVASSRKYSRKNTARWIKGLLAKEGAYETQFTDMPRRTRRDQCEPSGRDRARTAPLQPANELLELSGGMPSSSEAFTKTINDLEQLLSEALAIARQAADKKNADYITELKNHAVSNLKEATKARIVSVAYASKRLDNTSSAVSNPSIHESLRSYSRSSDSEESEDSSTDDEDGDDYPNIPEFRLEAPSRDIIVSTELSRAVHAEGSTPCVPGSAPQIVQDLTHQSNMNIIKERENAEPDRTNGFLDPFNSPGLVRQSTISRVSPTGGSPVKANRSRANTTAKLQKIDSICIDDHNSFEETPLSSTKSLPIPPITPSARGSSNRRAADEMHRQYDQCLVRISPEDSVPSKQEIRDHITAFHHPLIQPRISSLNLKKQDEEEEIQSPVHTSTGGTYAWQNIDQEQVNTGEHTESSAEATQSEASSTLRLKMRTPQTQSFDGMSMPSDALDFETGFGQKENANDANVDAGGSRGMELKNLSGQEVTRRRVQRPSHDLFSLSGRNHVSLRGEHRKGFSLTRSRKRQKIARDWAPARKRFVAIVACMSTALIGILTGIYAAEVPSIQYYIVDFHHFTILGNVIFFIGLAISTFLFWPLPLLHGRKPYILGSMCIAMPLLFPQALVVGGFRSPYVAQWRVALLLPRAVMGFVLGFANMNFKATLTDLFGASLQSANPHQEVVDENDVRRHGGGLGIWLGIWTWCTLVSNGIGFWVGSIIINYTNPAWGFYFCICIIAGVLLLNVVCPEVRRSAFRRSVAEVKNGDQVSRRLARGEVKMHMKQTGPKWWGEEFHHGIILSGSMLRQPGFLVLASYVAWIYGQIVLVVVLLGSLTSKSYHFKSPDVGLSVLAIPLGALLSIPFQKAGLFSRDRTHAEISDDDTRDKKIGWSSHLVRRAIFILCLPFAGMAYTLSSNGPPIPFILPIVFAGLIGFLSNLAMAECHGIIMETFDTSDLQPGMTGRPRKSKNDRHAGKRTNYSSFPRVCSAFAITQGLGYLVAAAATGVGGVATRHLGQQVATSVMAGILLLLSFLLLGVLVRFREVQIIPDMHKDAMERYMSARRNSASRRGEGFNDEDLRPTIIGNPTHSTRRMCILEMGSMSRWSEIRKKNHLVDQNSLEARHPNLAVIRDVEDRIKAKEEEFVSAVRRSLSREGSRRSRRSYMSGDDQIQTNSMNEPGDIGGHREMMSGNGLGCKSGKRRKMTIHE